MRYCSDVLHVWVAHTFPLTLPPYSGLYGVGILMHAMGLLLGNRAARFISQRAFDHVLMGLIVVCAALLFAAGFGVGREGTSGGQ